MIDVWRHIVMRQHDSITGPFKLLDFFDHGRERCNLNLREDAVEAFTGTHPCRRRTHKSSSVLINAEKDCDRNISDCNTLWASDGFS